jgi:hypothetical protein
MQRLKFANEEIDEFLIRLDWRVHGGMASINRDEVQRIVSGQLKAARTDIVADVVAALKPEEKASKWNHPWAVSLGSAVIGGLLVFGATTLFSHSAKDRRSEIADEVRGQFNGDASNQNARVAAEVGRQVAPIHQQIETLSQDIGKIKDHLHIARNEPPALPKPFTDKTQEPPFQVAIPPVEKTPPAPVIAPETPSLQAFAEMDPKTFARSLSSLPVTIRNTRSLPDNGLLISISRKLNQTDQQTPDYWKAIEAMINFRSSIRAGIVIDATLLKSLPVCLAFNGGMKDSEIDAANTVGGRNFRCLVKLDNATIINSTISNAVIAFTGSPPHLTNAHFVNCVFLVSFSLAPPPPASQDVMKKMLTADAGELTLTTPS